MTDEVRMQQKAKNEIRTRSGRAGWGRRAAWIRIWSLLLPGLFISTVMLPSAAHPTASTQAKLQPFVQTLPGSVVKIKMMPIPGGKVKIGAKEVEVAPFWMAQTETPWEAYDVFLASGPPSPAYDQTEYPVDAIARPSKSYILPDLGWGHNGYPVINVSFISTQMFCRWLSAESGKKFRLPTEAEWEFAARGGVAGPWKLDKAMIEQTTWWAGNAGRITNPVAKKKPNKYGLYDMLGNVGEWATDLEGKPVLCGGTHRDGLAGTTPATRRRWTPKWQETDPQFPKSRWWLADANFAGFRIVCEP